MTNSWKIRGNSCGSTQWLRQLAAIREIRRTDVTLVAWKAVPDWLCTALQAVVGIGAISPAHPRFSRMYGVTNSTVFQTVLNKRFFYDRRELFCPRILSFRSGSRWVRAHFLGKPPRLTREKENSHQHGICNRQNP